MTQDEIIRMAREAGLQASDLDTMFWQVMERFAALVAAHEREKQAEQELVAFLTVGEFGGVSVSITSNAPVDVGKYPLYASPVRTKDLTDEEAAAAAYKGFDDYWKEDCKGIEAEAWLASARSVIAADRKKNHA